MQSLFTIYSILYPCCAALCCVAGFAVVATNKRHLCCLNSSAILNYANCKCWNEYQLNCILQFEWQTFNSPVVSIKLYSLVTCLNHLAYLLSASSTKTKINSSDYTHLTMHNLKLHTLEKLKANLN